MKNSNFLCSLSKSDLKFTLTQQQALLFLTEKGDIALGDLADQLLLKQKNTNQMDISSLPTGIYFLCVGENKQHTIKVIKE